MKLYRNTNGQWFGTQADAKAAGADWQMVNVPTDKPNLLQWLNMGAPFEHDLCDAEEKISSHLLKSEPLPVTVKTSNITKPHAWQTIRECAEQADLKDLGVALAVLMNRLEDVADNVRH